MEMASMRIQAAQEKAYCVTNDARATATTCETWMRPCVPVANNPWGVAMLVGLNPNWFGWDLQEFVSCQETIYDPITAIQMLAVEYDEDGINEKFQSVVLGSPATIIGRASEQTQHAYESLGLGKLPLGGPVGKIDCHIGGVPHSCSEWAACIRYTDPLSSTAAATAGQQQESNFHLCCLSNDDVVTLNGQRITPSSGQVPLFDDDVCTVGPRVFAFVRLPVEHMKQQGF